MSSQCRGNVVPKAVVAGVVVKRNPATLYSRNTIRWICRVRVEVRVPFGGNDAVPTSICEEVTEVQVNKLELKLKLRLEGVLQVVLRIQMILHPSCRSIDDVDHVQHAAL